MIEGADAGTAMVEATRAADGPTRGVGRESSGPSSYDDSLVKGGTRSEPGAGVGMMLISSPMTWKAASRRARRRSWVVPGEERAGAPAPADASRARAMAVRASSNAAMV